MFRLYDELKRRNVLRIAAGCLASAWLVVQLIEALLPIFGQDEAQARWEAFLQAMGVSDAQLSPISFTETLPGTAE